MVVGRQSDLQMLAEYDFTGHNEAEIRGDWIEPLLRLLGYGLGTRHDIRRERSLRLDPPVRMIGSTRYEIDFIPTVFGRRLWIIEAKRPQGDLFGHEHMGQAWSYATDPRVAVPYIVLCDGARLGVFDVTVPDWTTPVFDHLTAELPAHFDELFDVIGAPRIAESTRRRQLAHLRTALEAQVDLGALDRTVEEVKEMVAEVRPLVQERRDEIRDEARRRVLERGRAATEAAGMWGLAGEVDGPLLPRWSDFDRAVEIVREKPVFVRVREFRRLDEATTPARQEHSRMWFGLRVVRMGAAALLCDEEGCEELAAVALEAARQHATAFADDPLLAAVYRLQRLLGPLGWRMAALTKPMLDEQAKKLAESVEAEEWLRLDGEIGVTGYDDYKRMALLLPRMYLAQVRDWSVEGLNRVANEVEDRLASLPTPPGFDHLQPAGDPWLDSWLKGDPLAELSSSVIDQLPERTESAVVKDLVVQMRKVADEVR
jgi:hypothetical protein